MPKAQVAIEVEGIKEFARKCARADKDLSKELRGIHKKVAEPIATIGRATAPKGPTGRLSGNVRASGTANAARVFVGGARVSYAGPIHWGWRRRNIQPNEFLTVAINAGAGEAMGVYEREMNGFIERIYERGGFVQ